MDGGTTFSVTYAELAAKLGITVPSVKNLCRRKRWPRHAGNDGLTRITVPGAYLEENTSTGTGTDAGADTSTKAGPDVGLHLAALAALERQIERLESEVSALKSEREVLASMPAQVAALNATLEAVTGERDRLLVQLRAQSSVPMVMPAPLLDAVGPGPMLLTAVTAIAAAVLLSQVLSGQ